MHRAARYLEPERVAVQPVPAPRAGELALFAAAAIVFIVAQILVAGPAVLYNRTCWIDESITQFLVADPSAAHSVEAIRNGVDTNPPIYHLLSRAIMHGAQSFSPLSLRATLRAFSSFCVVAAIVAAYALLRNSFAPWPSAIGLLVVWPHPQLIEQLFEARFYAPMLGAALALAVALQIRETTRAGGVIRFAAIAGCSTLLCTLHYFGIIVLAVLVVATACIETGSWARKVRRVAPAAVGILALLPFLLDIRTQAAGLTQATFLIQFSPRAAREFLVEVFYPLPMLILLAGWSGGQLLRQSSQTAPYPWAGRMRATVPLLSLAAVPLVIVAFSALVQSALRPRYAVVATFAIAPVAAMLAASLRPRMLCAIAVPLVVMGFMQISGTARMHAAVQQITTAQSVAARQDAPNVPIVFADRGDAIELAEVAPDLFPRIVLIDERGNPGVQMSPQRRYELEMTDKARKYYPTPPLVSARQLSDFKQVRIVGNSDDLSRILLETPMRRVGENLYEPVH